MKAILPVAYKTTRASDGSEVYCMFRCNRHQKDELGEALQLRDVPKALRCTANGCKQIFDEETKRVDPKTLQALARSRKLHRAIHEGMPRRELLRRLSNLRFRHLKVLELRYLGEHDTRNGLPTYKTTAAELGVSTGRFRQLEYSALNRLRQPKRWTVRKAMPLISGNVICNTCNEPLTYYSNRAVLLCNPETREQVRQSEPEFGGHISLRKRLGWCLGPDGFSFTKGDA